MKDKKFAREYITQIMHDKEKTLSVEDALRIVIRQMGTKEFAEMVNISPQNVTEFLAGRRNPKLETLNSFLRPFGLKLTLGIDYIDSEAA